MNAMLLNFAGDPNIGLYAFSTEDICFIPKLKGWVEKTITETLGIRTVQAAIAGTEILSIFAGGNSNGLVVSNLARKKEIDALKRHTDVLVLEGRYTATGNIILANDRGCIISDKIRKCKGEIEDFLKVKTTVHNIGKLDIVGSLSMATNRGCLVSKFASEKDIQIIEDSLGVKAGFATVNFGSNFLKSGVIANSKGVIMGNETTSPEMQNITEVLGFF